MNLPYTMTPEMVADAARAFKPKILYPYHFGKTDTARLVALLQDAPEIEVRVRPRWSRVRVGAAHQGFSQWHRLPACGLLRGTMIYTTQRGKSFDLEKDFSSP